MSPDKTLDEENIIKKYLITPDVDEEEIVRKYQIQPEKKPRSPVRESFAGAGRGLAKGFGGAYGDVLSLLGLQTEEQTPGRKAIEQATFEAPEYLLPFLTDEDLVPTFQSLPTSQKVERGLESIGIEKPQTATGKGLERIAEFLGTGLAFGQFAPKADIAAGVTGQALEELGAPKWLQAVGEIGAFIGAGPKKPLSIGGKEYNEMVKELRALGFKEQEITLAVNGAKKRGLLKGTALSTPLTRGRFEESFKNTENLVKDALERGIPDINKGVKFLEEKGADIFGKVEEVAESFVIKDPRVFTQKMQEVEKTLSKSLANTPQEKQVIELVKEASKRAGENPTADEFIRFYQGLNQIGNWSSPKQRERVFATIKDAVKETFKAQGIEGKRLAKTFEEANTAWTKFRNAEDVLKVMEKVTTDEAINYKKLATRLDNPDTLKTFQKGLGDDNARRLKEIAKAGQNIESLQKQIEGGALKKILSGGKLYGLMKGLATLNPTLLAEVIGTTGAQAFMGEILTNPKLQSLHINLLKSLNNNKLNVTKSILEKYERELNNLKKVEDTEDTEG